MDSNGLLQYQPLPTNDLAAVYVVTRTGANGYGK